MKKSARKIVSMFLAIIMLLCSMPFAGGSLVNVKAVSSVQSKLDSFISSYPPGNRWTGSFDGGKQCYGFAKLVVYNLFGKNSSGGYRSWTYAGVSTSGMKTLGSITNYSATNVKNLLSSAKCGDVLQFNTTKQHSMIIYSVDSSGVTVYDCNWDNNCGIRKAYVKFGAWSGRNSSKLTLLRSDNYPSDTIVHTVNSSYGKNFTSYPKAKITARNIYDANHNQISSTAWIGTSDKCTIHEVYTDGCCKISYPLDSGESKTVYSKISLFNVHAHSYSENYESAHPHKKYMKCSCGDWYYIGETAFAGSCSQCVNSGLSGSFRVKATSKVIRKGPASSYSVVKTVYSGDIINVVGYTYNEVGNLWYKTDSGDFIFHSYLEYIDGTALPSSNYLNATAKVMSSSKSVWSCPNGKTDPVSEIKSGDIVNIVGYLYNEYGTLWYELSDGTYVNSIYLKFITSNIRTPSDYYINTYKITASQKTLKSDPYSSSETTRELKNGDTIATVFYMYNRYGNLWYMTDKYDFIYESYLLPKEGTTDSPSVYCYRSFDCNTDKLERSGSYAVAETVKTISKSSRINTIGYVINLYGNKWYETVNGTFIHDSELTCVHAYDSGKITTVATCKATGIKTYTCTICEATKTETIEKDASNHVGGTAVKNVKSATCTSKGYTGDTYCLGCGVITVMGKDIDVKAHTYDSGKITTVATCKATGIKTYTCTICKATKTELIAKNASNHVGGTVVKNAKAATCTAKGYTGDTYCLGCGAITAKGKDIDVKAHTYSSGKITTVATCKSTGIKTYTCTVCEATKTETIEKNASNHVGGMTVIDVKNASCTSKGYTGDTYCLGCGAVITTGKEIAAKGHAYNADVIALPNCSDAGLIVYTCACGASYTETISALGHSYATAAVKATLAKDGSTVTQCTTCGAIKTKSSIPRVSSVYLTNTVFTYSGNILRLSVIVKDRTGKTLKNGTDYTVKYSSGCKNVGQYSVTVTLKGKYAGTKTLTYKIVPKGTSISKLTAGKKQFTAKWTAQTAQTTGYELQYSTSSSMSGAKTVTVGKNKTTSSTVKKLKGKKKYYVRIRTYKTVKIGGKTVKLYSAWSKVKSVKTK